MCYCTLWPWWRWRCKISLRAGSPWNKPWTTGSKITSSHLIKSPYQVRKWLFCWTFLTWWKGLYQVRNWLLSCLLSLWKLSEKVISHQMKRLVSRDEWTSQLQSLWKFISEKNISHPMIRLLSSDRLTSQLFSL